MDSILRRRTPEFALGQASSFYATLSFPWILVFIFMFMVMVPVVAIAENKNKSIINCDIQKGPCSLALKGRTITLDILPRPVKAMQELTFKVHLDGDTTHLTAPIIRLNMPAMDMGKNKVELKLNSSGVYEGKGVIVRCRSGRRTWKATVDFPDLGSVDFIFDVIY